MPVRFQGAPLAAAALALALAGCASALDSLTTSELRLKNPFETETNALAGPRRTARAVSAEDLIGPDGRCAFEAPVVAETPAPTPAAAALPPQIASPPPPTPPPSPTSQASSQALYFTAGPQAGGPTPGAPAPEARPTTRGIALDMAECDVVRVAGPTPNFQISANERGERTVTLTYLSGERPGIYHFVSGRLKSMERVAEPQVAAKPARRAKAKSRTQ